MLDANELIEEYMKHYECSKEKAVDMALEDIDLARMQLIEESIKLSRIKEVNNAEAQGPG